MVDLSGMREVAVDPARKRARAGGGALISRPRRRHPGARTRGAHRDGRPHRHRRPHARRRHGLADATGRPGLDNLESVEIVVADGRVLRASEQENPDLFWAVRGGGGNFGVVTEFEYRLHEVGPMIQFAFLFWEVERGARGAPSDPRGRPDAAAVVQRHARGRSSAPPAPFVPAEHRFRPGFALVLSGFGDPDEHAEAVDRLRRGAAAAVRRRHADALHRAAAAVRPGQLPGASTTTRSPRGTPS